MVGMRDGVASKGEKYYFVVISGYLRMGEAQDTAVSILCGAGYIVVYL